MFESVELIGNANGCKWDKEKIESNKDTRMFYLNKWKEKVADAEMEKSVARGLVLDISFGDTTGHLNGHFPSRQLDTGVWG